MKMVDSQVWTSTCREFPDVGIPGSQVLQRSIRRRKQRSDYPGLPESPRALKSPSLKRYLRVCPLKSAIMGSTFYMDLDFTNGVDVQIQRNSQLQKQIMRQIRYLVKEIFFVTVSMLGTSHSCFRNSQDSLMTSKKFILKNEEGFCGETFSNGMTLKKTCKIQQFYRFWGNKGKESAVKQNSVACVIEWRLSVLSQQ